MSQCCHGRWMGACEICKPIHTAKDQLYNFRWRYRNQTHDVHSKQQFTRLCTERGLTPVTKEDVTKQGVPYHPEPRRISTQQIQAALHDAKRQQTPERVEQVWKKTQQARGR